MSFLDHLSETCFGGRLSPEVRDLMAPLAGESDEVQAFIERMCRTMRRQRIGAEDLSETLAWSIAYFLPKILPGAWGGSVPPITSEGRHRTIDDYLECNPWRALGPGDRFLDLGCGFPPVTARDTARRFPDVRVTAPDPSFARYLVRHGNGDYACFGPDTELLYFQPGTNAVERWEELYRDPEDTRRRFRGHLLAALEERDGGGTGATPGDHSAPGGVSGGRIPSCDRCPGPGHRQTEECGIMEIDVERHLGTVERSVSSPVLEGQPARAVILSRSYRTGTADLWDAVTSAERIPRWFLPVSGTLEPGGRYQLEGNAGGEITACVQLSHFALTWEFGGWVSWVEVVLSADGERRARLALTPHRATLGALDRVRTGRGGCRLGAGSPGPRVPSRGPWRVQARRSRVCRFARRESIHPGKQRWVAGGSGRRRTGTGHRARGGEAYRGVLHGRTA